MKKILYILLIAILVFSIVACNGNNDTEETNLGEDLNGKNPEFIMRIAAATNNDPQLYEMEQFKIACEKNSNGRIEVEVYPAGQLGSNTQMLQGVNSGSIQGVISPTAFLGGFSDVSTIIDLPYFFEDVWSAAEILNSSEGDILREYLENKGLYAPSFYPYSDRIILATKPIRTMEDFKGKKIRIMGATVLQDQINFWGGAGVPMDVPELYTALQEGAIDGLESGSQFFEMGKYYEVAKYLITEPKGAQVSIFIMNKNWVDSLPDDLSQIVLDSAVEIRQLAADYARETCLSAVEIMKKEGDIEVIDISPEVRDEMIATAMLVHDKFLKDNPEVVPIYEALKRSIEKH